MLTGAEFRPPESQEFIGIEYTRRRAIFTYARRRQVGGFPVRSVTQIVGKVLWTLRWRGAKAAVAGLDPAYELEALKSAKKRPDDPYGRSPGVGLGDGEIKGGVDDGFDSIRSAGRTPARTIWEFRLQGVMFLAAPGGRRSWPSAAAELGEFAVRRLLRTAGPVTTRALPAPQARQTSSLPPPIRNCTLC